MWPVPVAGGGGSQSRIGFDLGLERVGEGRPSNPGGPRLTETLGGKGRRKKYRLDSRPRKRKTMTKSRPLTSHLLGGLALVFLIPLAGQVGSGDRGSGLFPSGSRLHAQELVRAAKSGRIDSAREILASLPGVLGEVDGAGYTSLRWAAIRGYEEIALALLEAGADPNSIGADGGTPLHGAAHHDAPNLMRALLEAGGDLSVGNRWGRTPLHIAARRGCLEVASILLDWGADPDAITNEGWSTLTVAYRGGHPDLVELLSARGADPAHEDSEGRKPHEVSLIRLPPVSLGRRTLDEYVGHYDLGDGFGFDVWRTGDRMHLMEFAPDEMVPVAPDTFFTVQEPWRVIFHRDGMGAVREMDVEFLRRTVSARKVVDTSEGFTYVGSGACRECHSGPDGSGGPYTAWANGRHHTAWSTLTTDVARGLAASREEYRDITEPSEDQRCLMCHVTAAQNPSAQWAPDGDGNDEGVGCEACHGPGSAYITLEVMSDREAYLANGGRIPDELTCRMCHRDEAFDYAARLEVIRHGG